MFNSKMSDKNKKTLNEKVVKKKYAKKRSNYIEANKKILNEELSIFGDKMPEILKSLELDEK